MRMFELTHRDGEVIGQGVEFQDGLVVMHSLIPSMPSVLVYDEFQDVSIDAETVTVRWFDATLVADGPTLDKLDKLWRPD